jgi:hypothetical protein
LYYQFNNSVICDDIFDSICVELLQRFDDISEYWKQWIEKESLEAGTGFGLDFWNLPQRVKDTACILNTGKDFSGKEIDKKKWIFTI